jgi:hypothetical protein
MNSTIESALRLVHVTTAGLLAGSLGFSDDVLLPGAEGERLRAETLRPANKASKYLSPVGPIALVTSMALAVGSRDRASTRVLDAASALALAGVVGATMLVTVPIGKEIGENRPLDYPDEENYSRSRNWSRAQSIRTGLGIAAFVCAAASGVIRRHRA